ncbi:unnamed protein product [Rotaria sordida]|uniref:EF-hand domain-containing protein n=1 Tax=Rotaria sordida TaxID=392033 RepID=A0A819LFT7_9BILA|nr:unnamed protein product [Rotaria sordida]
MTNNFPTFDDVQISLHSLYANYMIHTPRDQLIYNVNKLSKGLKVFDKEQNGSISSAELRHLLTNLGERLSDEEVEQLLSGFEDKNGLINYEDWIRKLLRN